MRVAQSCLALYDPMYYTVHGILQARILEGSLPLHQRIFATQGWNPGLPHCRRILYLFKVEGKSGRFNSSFARNPLFDGVKFKYKEMENVKYIIGGSDDLTHPCIAAP